VLNKRIMVSVGIGVLLGFGPSMTEARTAPSLCTALDGLPCRATSVRPQQLLFGADGRTVSTRVKWTGWGRATARGTARIRSNFAGAQSPPNYTYSTGTLTAKGLRTCHGRRYYTILVEKLMPGEPRYTEHIAYSACT
jgi:hypothetical protein